MKEYLEKLAEGARLTEQETLTVFEKMFAGELSESEIAGFLCLWRSIGETEVELVAGATTMRKHAVKPMMHISGELVDNCGTGGDGSNSFNISTASAIIAASMGVKIAKHGNRSVSSKCGSADLLFEAGVNDGLEVEKVAEVLEDKGFAFFFAPSFHPVMKEVMPVRRALGIRTVFNLLGPLANPVLPQRQVIGVGHRKYLDPMAKAAQGLGMKTAAILHGRDGLDEVSPEAITDVRLLKDGQISSLEIDPKRLGVRATLKDLAGGDPSHNFAMLETLLNNESTALCEAIALNVAPILLVNETVSSFEEGFTQALQHISTTAPKEYFAQWLQEVGR